MKYLPKNFNSPIYRVAVLGGSFDPPTLGHQNVIEQLMSGATHLGIDEIVLIPSVSHPFGKNLSPISYRLAMLALFIEDLVEMHPSLKAKIRILNIEPELISLHDSGYVYTYDVLEKVEKIYNNLDSSIKLSLPDAIKNANVSVEICFVIGPDLAQPEVFNRFYRAEELKKRWRIITVKQLRMIRSTEVRRKVAEQGLNYLNQNNPDLHPRVMADIIQHKRYGLVLSSSKDVLEAPVNIQIKVDLLIFSIQNNDLHILVHKNTEHQLPYVYINPSADQVLDDALKRGVVFELGEFPKYYEQVVTQGGEKNAEWCVNITYFCLTNQIERKSEQNTWLKVSDFLKTAVSIEQTNSLILSLERLKNKASYTSIPCYLATEPFTLSELQKIYEIVLGFKLEKKSFRRRLIESGLLIEIGQTRKANHRPAQLYQLTSKAYPLYYFARAIEGSRGH